jgi:MATE family multidrug resistance protein
VPTASDYAQPSHLASERRPLAELLALALPTVAQMASYTLMNFVDTWMLSRLGDIEATASGNASLLAFALISVGFGTMWVVNTLVSQAYGRGDARACGQHLWAGIWVGVGYGLLVLPAIWLARPGFDALGHEPRLAQAEATYFGIMLAFTPVRLAAAAVGQFLLAVDRPSLTLIAAVIGSVANVLANYALIWGNWGFPEMGVAGAAWGTNVGAITELAALAVFAMLPGIRRRYFVLDWRPRRDRVRTLLRVGLPSGGQMVGDVLAWALFGMWVMAAFGTQAMAASTYMMRYMSMSFLPAFGLSAGVTALVGRYIGRGEPEVARQRAWLGFKVAAAYMLACGLGFALFGRQLIGLFTDDPAIVAMGATLMLFAAAYQLFDALYIIYVGALRGAGDTFAPAVATVVLCWSMVIGLGGASAYFLPGLGIAGPWAVATVYGAVLGLFMAIRFRLGGWREIKLDGGGRGFEVEPAAR